VQSAHFDHARKNLSAVQQITGIPSSAESVQAVPDEVKACNFWLLAADPDHPDADEGWFLPSGEHLPVVEAFRQWAAYLRQAQVSGEPAGAGVAASSNVVEEEVAGEKPLARTPPLAM